MELRYCEECGDMIRLESDTPASLNEHFLCLKCKGDAPDTQTADARQDRSMAAFSSEELDLFSSQSIALKRQEVEAELRSPQRRLRLVKTTAASGVEAPSHQDSGDGEEAAPPPQSDTSVGTGAPTPGPPRPPPPESSGRPAKSARKIIFRCLHCKSPLSIRPVEKTSKLVCPSCQQAVYVTPDGRLLKNNPSHAKRKDAEADPRSGSESGRGTERVQVARLAAPQSRRAPQARPAPQAREESRTDDADDTLERLSAFEEHVFSQDPDKTAFLTEEASPLADLESSEVDEFPLASELMSTATRVSGGEEEPEEEWPEESDLLAEDEFDEDVGSGSRKRGRTDTRRQPTARILLVGFGLLLPFLLAAWLFVQHYAALEARSDEWQRMPTTLERLGRLAHDGTTSLLGDLPPKGVRWLPWSRP